jgi:hypothetical protein
MPSPIYQNMVNLVVHLPNRWCPSKFMNVTMWENHNFDSKILLGLIIWKFSVLHKNKLEQTLVVFVNLTIWVRLDTARVITFLKSSKTACNNGKPKCSVWICALFRILNLSVELDGKSN